MDNEDNPRGEFIWRMMGSYIQAFCREFGVEYMRAIIKYMAENEEFWELCHLMKKMEPTGSKPPFEREGSHDFIEEDNPPQGEKEE